MKLTPFVYYDDDARVDPIRVEDVSVYVEDFVLDPDYAPGPSFRIYRRVEEALPTELPEFLFNVVVGLVSGIVKALPDHEIPLLEATGETWAVSVYVNCLDGEERPPSRFDLGLFSKMETS